MGALSARLSEVRLRYPIVVNYLASLYRLVAALAFIIVVVRKLSVYEFGLWSIAFSLVMVFTVPVGLWMGWARRFVARGFSGAVGTSFALTALYALIAAPLHLCVAWVVSLGVGGFVYLGFYGLALLLSTLAIDYVRCLSEVVAPEVAGYSTGLVPTLRLVLAVLLVLMLRLGLRGAFLSVIVARLAGAVFIACALRLRGLRWDGVSRELAFSWLRRSYVTLMGIISSQLRALDRTLIAVAAGSAVPAAYLGAAYVARTPIGEAGRSVGVVLGARLLWESRGSDVVESLRLCLAFMGFVLATVVVLGKPILSLLNPRYTCVYPAFVLAALAAAASNISSIYAVASTATETADLDLEASLLGSRLVRTPLAVLCFNAVGLGAGLAAAWLLRGDPVAAATAFPAAWLAASIGIALAARRHALEAVEVRFPWREAIAVAAASAASGAVYLALGAQGIVVTSFWRQAPLLLGYLMVGLACYILVLYALSKWFRGLVEAALSEARRLACMNLAGKKG